MKNNADKKNFRFIIVYDQEGKFNGFYDDIDLVQKKIISQSNALRYNYITDEIHEHILNLQCDITTTPIINIHKISDNRIIDDINYLLDNPAETQPDMDLIKKNLTKKIKSSCRQFIILGKYIQLSSGLIKEFSFEIEDQINLQNIIAHYQSGDKITYHAKNETFAIYDYDDLCTIYRELYNNKLYNLIYTQVLCDYILNYYTEEQYLNKEVITYGYSNDKILEEVNRQYAGQLLQC